MLEIIGLIAGWIEAGAEAVLAATIAALEWAVGLLWVFATAAYNGLVALASTVLTGFQKAWDFLKDVYTDVLQPAWNKFWTLFDRVRSWLNDTFGPIIKFLQAVRTQILDFYKTWIRPILDTIDAARNILKILEALHLSFAVALDNWLGQVETAINYPFQYVIGKLNELINFVNTVMTADGLIQRVAHIRTLARDVNMSWRLLTQAPSSALTDFEAARLNRFAHSQTLAEQTDALVGWWNDESSDFGDALDSVVADGVAFWNGDAT